jgi:hypothetical protein
MDLPLHRLVRDTLHQIADLVQEADAYLCESDLFKSSTPRPPLPKSAVQPHKADRLTNRARKMGDFLTTRNLLRARRERKQRDRDHAKSPAGAPEKRLGTRLRKR